MSENIAEPDRPQTKIGRMRIACRVPKATIAQLLHVNLMVVIRKRLNVTFHVYCLSFSQLPALFGIFHILLKDIENV